MDFSVDQGQVCKNEAIDDINTNFCDNFKSSNKMHGEVGSDSTDELFEEVESLSDGNNEMYGGVDSEITFLHGATKKYCRVVRSKKNWFE